MRTLATFRSRRARLGRLKRLSAQHPPFKPCARCHVYTLRYRWRSELRSGGPDLEWGGRFAHDFVVVVDWQKGGLSSCTSSSSSSTTTNSARSHWLCSDEPFGIEKSWSAKVVVAVVLVVVVVVAEVVVAVVVVVVVGVVAV